MGNKSLVKAQHLVKHAWNVTLVGPVLSLSSTWRTCRHVEGCRYQTVVIYPCLDLYVSNWKPYLSDRAHRSLITVLFSSQTVLRVRLQ